MEDSEQRKKRLKEMRHQADLAQVSGDSEGSGMPGLLSNPLIEAPSTMPSRAAPRFDFYTDPMNAFSSNKRNNASVQVAPDYLPPPSFRGAPIAQFSSPHPESINQRMTPSFTQASPAPYGNPVWNGPRGPAHYNAPVWNGPRGPAHCNAPVWNGPRGPAHYSSNPRFEPPGSSFYNAPQGIIHQPSHSPNPSPGYRNSPNPSPGRGRGFWHNRNPVSGQGSGRGRSSHGHLSNEDRAYGQDRFYKRSMVEDPWKLLKPVIWKVHMLSLTIQNHGHQSQPGQNRKDQLLLLSSPILNQALLSTWLLHSMKLLLVQKTMRIIYDACWQFYEFYNGHLMMLLSEIVSNL